MWKVIKHLIRNISKSKDTNFICDKSNSEIANKFNRYFINLNQNLDNFDLIVCSQSIKH